MRIGLMVGAGADQDSSFNGVLNFVKQAENQGFDSVWMANIFGFDAVAMMTVAGRETTRIELGTAVVPSYPRHPTALAQQALTASVATDGRFVLGLGLSHKLVIEDMLGLSYQQPAKHMNEYLQVLVPLLRGEAANFDGEQYQVYCQMDVQGAKPVPLIVAALGPVMLKLAATLADGTTTWMTGTQTLAGHIIPTITKFAAEANRSAPRIIAGLPIALTGDVEQAKAKINQGLEIYGTLPSYRAMLDREAAAGPADIALVGDEAALRAKIKHLRDIGVTDFNAAIMHVDDGSFQRTLDFLQTELG